MKNQTLVLFIFGLVACIVFGTFYAAGIFQSPEIATTAIKNTYPENPTVYLLPNNGSEWYLVCDKGHLTAFQTRKFLSRADVVPRNLPFACKAN